MLFELNSSWNQRLPRLVCREGSLQLIIEPQVYAVGSDG